MGANVKITGFDISNFKGIRKAQIRFSDHATARVHTLVGLNESGKTTLLEAMHLFRPDEETQFVVKNARNLQEQRVQWVPRERISNFTDSTIIQANILTNSKIWGKIRSEFKKESKLETDEHHFPNEFSIQRIFQYKNGDYDTEHWILPLPNLRVKTQRAKKWRKPVQDEFGILGNIVWDSLPAIVYYPTFLFDFPKKIYLTSKNKSIQNSFYRQLFQDILGYDGSGYTIEKDIIVRLQKKVATGSWEQSSPQIVDAVKEDQVQQVLSHAEKNVTQLIFTKWEEIFGENSKHKEIEIKLRHEKEEADVVDIGDDSAQRNAYIRFRIKDGVSSYEIEERSLGFQWFFSFLLFTQFRTRRDLQKPTIFLFDEPASNLHPVAQKKLLESFPTIASPPHQLVYSTHSHYMVNPKWLEQAFIIFDKSVSPDSQVIDDSHRTDSSTDIQVIPYRKFINDQPNKISYFQPILDTLEVQPSPFDYKVSGLIVEGKSDYYFLKFSARVAGREIEPIFPAQGSGTMGSLVALHRGWDLPVRVLFDSDRGGEAGRKNLQSEFEVTNEEASDLNTLVLGIKKIEDIFSNDDQAKLADTSSPNKKPALLRRVQEFLAADEIPELDQETKKNMVDLVDAIIDFMPSSSKSTTPA